MVPLLSNPPTIPPSNPPTPHKTIMATDHSHKLPLWGLFLALAALTAAEVGLYETWTRVEALQEAMPKYALVLLIFVFTLPKAAIVLVYFMHIKFEKLFIVGLSLCPLIFAALAVLPTLVDALAIKDRAFNDATYIDRSGHGHGEGDGHHADEPKEPEPDPNDPFSLAPHSTRNIGV